MKNYFIFGASLVLLLLSGCKKFEGDITRPAWLEIDHIDVVRADSGENERSSGWYTSDIDAAEVIILFHGDMKETNLGAYQLPCRIPVLRNEVADYIAVRPWVKQNGIAATRFHYEFLRDDSSFNVPIVPGETTRLGTYDSATNQYNISVTYLGPNRIDELFFENFEPLASSIRMTEGKFEWINDDAAGACTGSGYVRIPTAADGNGTYLEITDSMRVDDPSKYLYLEMDYRSDVEFRIGMRSPITSGGANQTYYALNLYPKANWTKIYINLGRLWGQMNHYPEFHVVFHTLNMEQKSGYTYIDNLKIITL